MTRPHSNLVEHLVISCRDHPVQVDAPTLSQRSLIMLSGLCITTVLPGTVCGLEAATIACEDFAAITCTCQHGYQYQEMMCTGMEWEIHNFPQAIRLL